MHTPPKVFYFFQVCVEEIIPVCSFSIMFLTFIIQIFFRYVLKSPQAWAYEVTVTCYLWTVMFGACCTTRKKKHVKFSIVYDLLKPKGKAIITFLGDAIIVAAFVAMLLPTIDFISQIKMQTTAMLKIGLNVVYAPFIPFMFIVIGYMSYEMYESFLVFSGLGGEVAVTRMLNENKSEVEQAIEQTAEEKKIDCASDVASEQGGEPT